MWANGLISAAKSVAGATQLLVKSANNTVTSQTPKEEELVAVARSVAAATAQLVAASRAKAEPGSAAHQTLSSAAKVVTQSTTQLVNAAKSYTKLKLEQDTKGTMEATQQNYTDLAVKQLEQQMKILKLEKVDKSSSYYK